MIPEDGVNDEELEAEFLALVGGQPQALEKLKGKGKKDAQHTLWNFCCGQYLEGAGQALGWIWCRFWISCGWSWVFSNLFPAIFFFFV